jgi:hypothetical protein
MREGLILPSEEELRRGVRARQDIDVQTTVWLSWEPTYLGKDDDGRGRTGTAFIVETWQSAHCQRSAAHETYAAAVDDYQDQVTGGAVYIAKKALGLE